MEFNYGYTLGIIQTCTTMHQTYGWVGGGIWGISLVGKMVEASLWELILHVLVWNTPKGTGEFLKVKNGMILNGR